MIRVIEGEKSHLNSFEKYDQIIEIAKKEAFDALFHFFDLIGLDKSLFTHLKDINFVLDLDDDISNAAAFYENLSEDDIDLDNSIHFLPDYLDELIKYNNSVSFSDLATTIIHETIHSLRSISINNGVLFPESFTKNASEYESFVTKYNHLIKDSDSIYQVLSFSRDLSTYTIYCYERLTGDFSVFKIPSDKIGDISSTSKMEELLNKHNDMFHLVKNVENPDDYDNISLISNYSLLFKDRLKVKKDDFHLVGIETDKLIDFEESLTEAFAQIIYFLKDKDEFNLDGIGGEECLPHINITFELIKTLDMDTIRWFFLSCFGDEYVNRFNNLYQENYNKLIDKLSLCFHYSMGGKTIPNYEGMLYYVRQLKK